MKSKILVKEIINFLNSEILSTSGKIGDLFIKHLKPSELVDEYTLDWVNNTKHNKQEIAENSKAKVILVDNKVEYSEQIKQKNIILIFVDNPRLAIAKVANEFFMDKYKPSIHKTASIDSHAKIGNNVFIGPNVVIEKCKIGDNVIIHDNVSIKSNVIISNNVIVHSGAILGVDGLGSERQKDMTLVNFPHLGKLIIESNVSLGAGTIIAKGSLSDTFIGNGSKINSNCYIAHNVKLGRNTWLSPKVNIAGSVTIKDNVTIFSGAILRDGLVINEGVTIGMGSVIIKNIPANETWIGNPAKKMDKK